ncbi:hypothetical protein K437DRAFT_14739 [Tilletiaria anomala UBC 951]|uniref:Uncharacterized protein n=1 Tax=Tilletiaria anomala (strain ATCC 24038 / CBS 436.72 / UBC 951) TaxID=1037660 RepID=A0A066VFJ8_TILAU|nr:uncharacterized protein K437DRAFT_14739 [Tilletiaria anomala UBC 951]KDN39083.1 hypothetical protein K437DRAFT_14739 [Tilletiaria anomala UBC 951]
MPISGFARTMSPSMGTDDSLTLVGFFFTGPRVCIYSAIPTIEIATAEYAPNGASSTHGKSGAIEALKGRINLRARPQCKSDCWRSSCLSGLISMNN